MQRLFRDIKCGERLTQREFDEIKKDREVELVNL
jgi:hypothetical protein